MFKRIVLTFFVLLLSTVGWASNSCPDLSGVYDCPPVRGQTTAATIEIKQVFSQWSNTFVFDMIQRDYEKIIVSRKFVADGQTYVESKGQEATTAECINGESLKVSSSSITFDSKSFRVHTYSKDKDDNLRISSEWRVQNKDGNEDSGSTKHFCRGIN